MAVVRRQVPTGRSEKVRPTHTPAEEPPELSLPTEISQPMERFEDYSWLLFGEKKIGKTTLLSQFPDTFFLMTEPGGKALSIYQRPVTTWKEFVGYVKLLEKDRRFKRVVVDTIDYAFKMAERTALQKLGISDPSEETWGKGWRAVRDEFTPPIQRLLSCGKGVTFISHSTEREVKRRDGSKYDRIQPTMSGTARDVVEGMVDIWTYYSYDGKERYLHIKGDDHISAGHRLQDGHFRYKNREIERVWMGRSPKESYTNLIAAFENRYTPPAFETPTDEPAAAPVSLVKKRKV